MSVTRQPTRPLRRGRRTDAPAVTCRPLRTRSPSRCRRWHGWPVYAVVGRTLPVVCTPTVYCVAVAGGRTRQLITCRRSGHSPGSTVEVRRLHRSVKKSGSAACICILYTFYTPTRAWVEHAGIHTARECEPWCPSTTAAPCYTAACRVSGRASRPAHRR